MCPRSLLVTQETETLFFFGFVLEIDLGMGQLEPCILSCT